MTERKELVNEIVQRRSQLRRIEEEHEEDVDAKVAERTKRLMRKRAMIQANDMRELYDGDYAHLQRLKEEIFNDRMQSGDTSVVDNARYVEAMEGLDEKYPNKDKDPYDTRTVDFNEHSPYNNKIDPFAETFEFDVIPQVAKLREQGLKNMKSFEPNTSEDLADGEMTKIRYMDYIESR